MQISEAARREIASDANERWLSVASIWEIGIKTTAGKLELPERFQHAVDDAPIGILPIIEPHAYTAGRLPLHHRDPFDRMLVAQAIEEDMVVVTRDTRFAEYGIGIVQA